MNNNKNLYNFSKFFNIFFLKKQSIIYLNGYFGTLFFRLSSSYLFINKNNKLLFLFINKFNYNNFIKNIFNNYNNLFKIFCVRLKIRGLGYRIRKITKNLYYFFFNYTNMFYFNIPNNILIKWYKKRIILLSNNFIDLKIIFSHILLLKNLGPYRLRGLRYPKQIILLKKKIKKI
jgi:ribosomal protein L6P/L9E